MRKTEDRSIEERAGVRMWPGVAAGVVIGLIAFVLSFDALRLVFVACGINPYLSWGGPVCVDGTILLCTWATWGFKKGHIRGAAYPWVGLVIFSLFSIAGNALHALLANGWRMPAWVSPAIMSIPPVALLYATHLIVIIAGDRLDKINTILDPDAGNGAKKAEPETAPAPTAKTAPRTVRTEPAPMPAAMPEPAAPPIREEETFKPITMSATAFTPIATPEPEPVRETAPTAPASEPAAELHDAEPERIPDNLWDMTLPVPNMEDDARPKAVEAESRADDASDSNDGVARERVTVPTVAASPQEIERTTEPEPEIEPEPEEKPEPDEPVRDTEPEPETEEAEQAAEPDVEPEPAEAGQAKENPEPGQRAAETPDGEESGDGEWLEWADRVKAEGKRPTMKLAVDDGLASSTIEAKRHLRKLHRDYPGRF